MIAARVPCAWREYRPLNASLPATRLSSSVSTTASFVIVTSTFCVFAVEGPSANVLEAMLKSVSSDAVLPVSTSTANPVDSTGSQSTVTGTLSVPPDTFSATVTVCFSVEAAEPPERDLPRCARDGRLQDRVARDPARRGAPGDGRVARRASSTRGTFRARCAWRTSRGNCARSAAPRALGARRRARGRRCATAKSSSGGFFLADKEEGAAFTADDEEILVLFASQAAAAIANTRAYREVERARADLETLVETCTVGVVVFDAATGRAVSVNREARRIVEEIRTPGCPTEQLLDVITCRHADGREVSLAKSPLARQLEDAEESPTGGACARSSTPPRSARTMARWCRS